MYGNMFFWLSAECSLVNQRDDAGEETNFISKKKIHVYRRRLPAEAAAHFRSCSRKFKLRRLETFLKGKFRKIVMHSSTQQVEPNTVVPTRFIACHRNGIVTALDFYFCWLVQ